jgi:YegS/Rv2252/BmrU family lipid kinase
MLWLIVNPAAGDGRTGGQLQRITAELTGLGLEHVVHRTTSLDHARELAGAAVAEGAMPVTFGGDGLIGAVAGAIAHTGAVMGILPGGRGNDIARVLGIPRDPVRACRVLAVGAGTDRTLDLGRLDGAPFIGIASCGMDSDANAIANTTRIRGSLAYSYGGLRALAQWQPAQFTVAVEGVSRSFRGYSVAVANSRSYGGGMLMAPDAELDDGQLDVVTIAAMAKLKFLANMPRIFSGSHLRMGEVSHTRASRVEISADRPFAVFGDGEQLAELPVTLTCDPAAVQIRVPAGAVGAAGALRAAGATGAVG